MKKLIYVVLSGAMAASVVACKPAQKEVPIYEITVVGDYGNFEALEAEFDKFMATHENIHLSYENIGNMNKLSTILEGDEKPNIFFTKTSMIGNSAYDSVFAHAEDLSDPALEMNLTCIRSSLLSRTSDNKVLMAPIFSRTYGILVNHDLFTKENIEIPTSWTNLLAACEAFHEKGYVSPMMGYSKDSSACLMYTIAYPMFVAELANNPEALAKANNKDPEAGEYMRKALTAVDQLVNSNAINIEECNKIENNYEKVLLRFLDGDVPMMICGADTPSGIKKREGKSAPFAEHPFTYAFHPIPVTEQGGYFMDSPSIEFSVNKDCDNLDVTNEFMRFLLSDAELNSIAAGKGLVATTNNMSFESLYAPFGNVPAERTFSPELLGVKDALTNQIKVASYKVGKGELTIDQAIEQYGTF